MQSQTQSALSLPLAPVAVVRTKGQIKANGAGSFIEGNTWRQLRVLAKKESGK